MFVHAVPDNRGKKDGFYCSLVESHRINGVPMHSIKISFGFVPSKRLPYLKAAFNNGNPAEILEQAIRSLEKSISNEPNSSDKQSHGRKSKA